MYHNQSISVSCHERQNSFSPVKLADHYVGNSYAVCGQGCHSPVLYVEISAVAAAGTAIAIVYQFMLPLSLSSVKSRNGCCAAALWTLSLLRPEIFVMTPDGITITGCLLVDWSRQTL